MEKIILKGCSLRKEKGKERVKKLRRKGFIPGVVYSKNFNLLIKVPKEGLKELKAIHFSESVLIEMEIEDYNQDGKILPVLIKDVQYHPLKEEVLHIDFFKVSLKEKIRTKVPLVLKGEPEGVKLGGVLEQLLWEVEIEVYPTDIPEKIEVDVASLNIGSSLHIGDLELPPKIKILESKETPIVTLVAKKEEEEVPAEEEEVVPEVVKEKKEKKEEE